MRRRWWRPGSWAETQRPATLVVVRVLLVANGLLLAVVGGLYALFASRPQSLIVTGVCWALATVLACLVRFTDPRRGDRGRW